MKNLNNFDASQQQTQPIWSEGHSQNSEARKKKKKRIEIRKEEVRLLYISRKSRKNLQIFQQAYGYKANIQKYTRPAMLNS